MDNISDQELLSKFGDLDSLFQQADADGDGGISAKEATAFFPKFDVPQPVLKYLWKQCVSDPSKGVQKHEFTTAMKIIYQAKQKQAQSMPPKQQEQLKPLPTQVTSHKTGEGSPFMIHPQQQQNYSNYFNNITKGAPTASGKEVVSFLQQSGVDNSFLKQVWDLCDVKKQGALSKHYFGVAMHLVGFKKKNENFQLPSNLPTTLLDPDSKTPTGSFSMGSGGGSFNGMLQPQPMNGPQSGGNSMNNNTMGNMNNMGGMGSGMNSGMSSMNNMGGMSGPIQTTTKVNSLLKETNNLKDDHFQMQQQVSQAQMNLEQNKQQEQQLLQEIQSLKPQIEELRIQKQQYQQEQARIESRLLMLREDNKANNELSLQLKTEVERLELLKKNGEETVTNLSKNLEDVGETIKSDTSLLEEKQSEILKLKTEYDSLVQKMNDFQGTVNQTQLDNITEQVKQQHIQNDQLSTKLASLETKNEEMTKKYETNKKIHDDFTLKIKSLNEQIVEVEKQIEEKSKIPNLKPKLVRLDQFHDTAVKYIKEMQNILDGLKSDNSNISPLNEDLFSKPIETKSKNKNQEQKKQVDNNFGFDDAFGEKDSFDSFEDTSGFGKDFSIQNSTGKATATSTPKKETPLEKKTVSDDPGPQTLNIPKKQEKPQEPSSAPASGFDDFDGFGKSSGFDDFDSFGGDTKATTEPLPKTSSSGGFDDFDAFGDSKPTETAQEPTSGFDSFDGFGNDDKKASGSGFDDFGFDDFGTDGKKDDGFGNDAFDGFGNDEKKETKANDDWSSEPW
eukprot:gene9056-1153_t